VDKSHERLVSFMKKANFRFEEDERQKLIEGIIVDINKMNFYELESLKSISSNIGKFNDFINGVKFFLGDGFK